MHHAQVVALRVRERMQAVERRLWNVRFFLQDMLFDAPVMLGAPLLYNLHTGPHETGHAKAAVRKLHFLHRGYSALRG